MDINYFSAFSGIGGFELGMPKNWECIGYSEIDKYAIQVYQKHFPKHKNYGDITTINIPEIPDHDLLCGGFPCQSFSVAGKRGGFEDTRGTLFFYLAEIAKIKRPSYLFFENVKGLLSHDKGNTFATIISTLDELGYDCEWQVLNSKNFGVPQNRERVFIIGHLRGKSRPEVFPIIGCDNKDNRRQQSQNANCITSNYYKTPNAGNYLKEITKDKPDAQRIYDSKGIAKTLKGEGGGQGAKTGLYAVPLKFLERNQKNYQGDYSFTVDTSNTGGILKDSKIRRLTPTECERLQGFPDDWTKGISDTQRYKCLGNAVTVNVIKAIMDKFI